uniref:Uncharacterized protein n=1 Tax=Arion vulgaris TaxID=1028688 RepID=A0A0B7AVU7_9EUPU
MFGYVVLLFPEGNVQFITFLHYISSSRTSCTLDSVLYTHSLQMRSRNKSIS